MMKFVGGDTAPRSGFFPFRDGWKVLAGHGENALRGFEVKAGEKFPGDKTLEYELGPLRPGEVVPKAGVWFNNLSSLEYKLLPGDAFPDGDPASDYVWVREA